MHYPDWFLPVSAALLLPPLAKAVWTNIKRSGETA